MTAKRDRIISCLPDESFDKLPTDLAEQHDPYIYGIPKRSHS